MGVQAHVNGGTAEQRREQMLRAALEVIVERGFAETRIADVAERAGTSPALVIYYFKTKDQLLTDAIRYSQDTWYAEGQRRTAAISTAAGKLEEIIAMSCLPEADAPTGSWVLWLDFWAQAARHPGLGSVRQKADERWRETLQSLVHVGQDAGEFRALDALDFAVSLSALLDGLAVQIALADPVVDAGRAFDLSMRFCAQQLGFEWTRSQRRADGPACRPASAQRAAERTRSASAGPVTGADNARDIETAGAEGTVSGGTVGAATGRKGAG